MLEQLVTTWQGPVAAHLIPNSERRVQKHIHATSLSPPYRLLSILVLYSEHTYVENTSVFTVFVPVWRVSECFNATTSSCVT
jgi:hypothetical protein